MLIQEALKAQIESKGLTRAEVARQAGISRGHLSDLLNGNKGITETVAVKLESVLGLAAEKILLLQTRENLEKARNGNGNAPAMEAGRNGDAHAK